MIRYVLYVRVLSLRHTYFPYPVSSQTLNYHISCASSAVIGQFGHCNQDLLNLLLTGRATSNVMDGQVAFVCCVCSAIVCVIVVSHVSWIIVQCKFDFLFSALAFTGRLSFTLG